MVTTNVKSYLNEPDNPLDRWDSEEINSEQVRLQNYINTSIPANLMSFNSAQTSSGQKFFKHLYFTNGNSPSYETVMQSLDNDISPVFGSGAKAIVPESISDSQIKKGYFSSSNVSGVKLPLSARNPLFIKSNISIKCSDGSNVVVDAKNIPLSSFDNFKSGTPSPANGNNIQSVEYPTSVSYSGTVNISSLIGSLSATDPIQIIIAKKDDETITCFLVVSGNESNIDSSYTMFKRIGFCYSANLSTIVPFVISNGRFIPGTHNNYSLNLPATNLVSGTQTASLHCKNLTSIIRDSCIVVALVRGLDGQKTFTVNSNTYTITEGPVINATAYSSAYSYYYVPFIWSSGSFYQAGIDSSATESNIIYVQEIIFGGLF